MRWQIIGRGVDDPEAHLSGTTKSQMRDCVYFAPNGDRGLVTLSVRQEATSAEAIEGVINGLRAEYPPGTSVSDSGTAFAYCWQADSCWTSLAFGVPPYFFVVNVRRDVGDLGTAEALANAVLENLARCLTSDSETDGDPGPLTA
jgi:hypothetical protein